MIEVAKVVKADKIRRLQQERQLSKAEQEKSIPKNNFDVHESVKLVQDTSFDADEQKKLLAEKQKELQIEYQRAQEKIERENRKRAERAEKLKAEELARKQQMASANNSSKKVWGIVALVAVAILVIILVAVLR